MGVLFYIFFFDICKVEVFWETNAVYAKSLDQLGQRVVFARDGETNQTVNLEVSLIGVYTLRCSSTAL